MRIIDPADILELLFLQTSLVEIFISWKKKYKRSWNLHGLLSQFIKIVVWKWFYIVLNKNRLY